MASQSFTEAYERDNQRCNLTGPDGKTYEGFFANIRVNRDTLPEGWYAYDIRDADSNGEPCEIKAGYVIANHFGTFCTRTMLPLESGGSWYAYKDGTGEFELDFC